MNYSVSFLISAIVISIAITSCGPSSLTSYEDKLYGVWHLYKVKKQNTLVPFASGNFFFYPSGKLVYRDIEDHIYEGTWAWHRSRHSDFAMNITVIDFTNHKVKMALFDKWTMTKKNEAKAKIWAGSDHNVFYFSKIKSLSPRQ